MAGLTKAEQRELKREQKRNNSQKSAPYSDFT
jgi:hypothetical protein